MRSIFLATCLGAFLVACEAAPPARLRDRAPVTRNEDDPPPAPAVPLSAPVPVEAADSPPPAKVQLEFHDADVKTVLLALAQEAGANIVLPSDLEGRVTLILHDVSWLEALHVVAEVSGHVVVHEGPRDNR